jgi:pimeloyl-ACP methyl ester carboxylesterase
VRDFAVLQDRAMLHGPHVIVASSIGGLTAELFARQFPERVAGLVHADAANSFSLALRESVGGWVRPAACTSGFLARFGVIRLIDPFGLGQETTEEGRRSAAVTYNSRPWNQLCAMARGLPDTIREFASAAPLRADLPLTVLSASTAEELLPPGLGRFVDVDAIRAQTIGNHQQFAKQSTKGKWLMVPDSTHLIAGSQPDVVADAVLEMVEQVR